MKTIIASVLAACALAGATPAMAQDAQKTEAATQLVDVDGKTVHSLLLRYAFDASWVVDPQHILVRDTYRDHYVVATDQPCGVLEGTYKGFEFFPALSGSIRAGNVYEVRHDGYKPCTISSITQVATAQANELKSKVAQKG